MITIPTIKELYDDILADLESQFNITIPLIGKNFLRVLAGVQAGKLKLYYLVIGVLQKNIFPDTADSESQGGTLERFGRVKLGRNPFPAQAANYRIVVTGSIGGFIKASTTFKSNDDSLSPGILYVLDDEYTLVDTTDYITVRALTAGLEGKLSVGDGLTATAPIALVNSAALVDSEMQEPLAAQTIENYRQQVLNAFRLEPQGGASVDYIVWAQDAQGVATVYPYAKSGAHNELNIFVEANISDSTDGRGTPSAGMLEAVEEVIELDPNESLPIDQRGRRPLGIFQINYLPVSVKEIEITITGFAGLSVANKALIDSALEELINSIRPFIDGAYPLSEKNDTLDTNRIIATVLSIMPGGVFSSVEMKVDGVVTVSKTYTNGDIPYLVTPVTYA